MANERQGGGRPWSEAPGSRVPGPDTSGSERPEWGGPGFESPRPEEPRTGGFPPADPAPGRGGLGGLFAPRSFGGGRVQVWGCSPGCLVVSILGSILLTLLLNGFLGLLT